MAERNFQSYDLGLFPPGKSPTGKGRGINMNIVDMHCDTISALWKKRRNGERTGLLENDCHVDLKKLHKSGYLLQNFALFVELEAQPDPWEQTLALYGLYREEMEKNKELIVPALCFSDIEKNRRDGKLSALLTVEEGGVCQGQTDRLRKLYHMGVRMLTLTWNYRNELGSPNLERHAGKRVREGVKGLLPEVQTRKVWDYLNMPQTKQGLTEKGIEFVQEMEALGMIVDVSHLSDAGFYDVLKNSKKPFAASHSNARSLCPCARNLNDHMIRALAERGGVTGLNFCADFLVQLPPGVYNPGTVEAAAEHAKHIVRVGGIECLGLGSDFDGIDTHEGLPDAGKMDRLYAALQKKGFSAGQIDRIFSENVLRLYRDVLK